MWLFMPADLSQQWSNTFFSFIISDEEGISAVFIKIKQRLYSGPTATLIDTKTMESYSRRIMHSYCEYERYMAVI